MTNVITVLRSGGEYKPEHVQLLAQQVPELVCVSDVSVDGVKTIPLPADWPGWWSKISIFKPDLISGDIFYLDLDTVVLRDISELIDRTKGTTTMLSDFYWPEHPASGLMYIAECDKTRVWDAWTRDPVAH